MKRRFRPHSVQTRTGPRGGLERNLFQPARKEAARPSNITRAPGASLIHARSVIKLLCGPISFRMGTQPPNEPVRAIFRTPIRLCGRNILTINLTSDQRCSATKEQLEMT